MVMLVALALGGTPEILRRADGGFATIVDRVSTDTPTLTETAEDTVTKEQLRRQVDLAWGHGVLLGVGGLTALGLAVGFGTGDLAPFDRAAFGDDTHLAEQRGVADWKNDMVYLSAALATGGAMFVVAAPFPILDARRRYVAHEASPDEAPDDDRSNRR